MSMQGPVLRKAVLAAGLGTSVLLLHGSASSSAMWTPVINALKARFRLIAPDLIGYGRTDAWPDEYEFRLDDELRLIEPLIEHQPGGSHIVGHSYGGVAALALARRGVSGTAHRRRHEPVAGPAHRGAYCRALAQRQLAGSGWCEPPAAVDASSRAERMAAGESE